MYNIFRLGKVKFFISESNTLLAQTFLATKSGPVNLIALYALASTPSAITMTLETLGGGSVLGTSTQSFSGGNVYFTFSNKPVITSGSKLISLFFVTISKLSIYCIE